MRNLLAVIACAIICCLIFFRSVSPLFAEDEAKKFPENRITYLT